MVCLQRSVVNPFGESYWSKRALFDWRISATNVFTLPKQWFCFLLLVNTFRNKIAYTGHHFRSWGVWKVAQKKSYHIVPWTVKVFDRNVDKMDPPSQAGIGQNIPVLR